MENFSKSLIHGKFMPMTHLLTNEYNLQLQPFNATYVGREGAPDKAKFGRKVNDCAPLFSTGTWMGLIVALLLISVLSFGFLMLNSVQTMDRFDDPKQKQLVINAKE